MRIFRLICLFAVTLLLAGCFSSNGIFSVSVNGFAKADAGLKKTFIILPALEGVKPTDLEFQEYASITARVLEARGFKMVSGGQEAELAIFLSYSVGQPSEKSYSYSIPQFGQTGVASSQTYGTVSATGNFTARTYNTPSYGVTGYQRNTISYTTYARVIGIEALDVAAYRENGQLQQIWKTTIVSVGSNGDLRTLVPIMLVAASAYIGTSTGKIVELSIESDDPRLLAIRRPQPMPLPGALPSANDQNLPPSKFKPVGTQVGVINLVGGLDPAWVRDMIAQALLAREWEVNEKANDHVVGHIMQRSSEAILTLVFDSDRIELYCEGWKIDKKTGVHIKPALPNGWIENIVNDIKELLKQVSATH